MPFAFAFLIFQDLRSNDQVHFVVHQVDASMCVLVPVSKADAARRESIAFWLLDRPEIKNIKVNQQDYAQSIVGYRALQARRATAPQPRRRQPVSGSPPPSAADDSHRVSHPPPAVDPARPRSERRITQPPPDEL